ncbi:MAG: T9SS type A sorting domain-containing protein [Ignavibacteriales bacterium]|nr:T9SS type A sorting domain-containing protein [Ignavibacteriales bacterium]
MKDYSSVNQQTRSSSYYSVKYPPNGIKSEEDKDIDFHLSQNYPNPFNSETLISFSVPFNSSQTSKVTFEGFDFLGSVKEILYNGEMATGDHQIRFTGENLPSGIYFYELNIDGRREIKKMILQK